MPYINLATSINTNAQIPLNYKGYFKTLAEMRDLGDSDFRAYIYYDGMIVFCLETEKQYIWKSNPGGLPIGVSVLEDSFTYPENVISDGIDYSEREFDFYEYNPQSNLVQGSNVVVYGSIVWVSGLTYSSTEMGYIINNQFYTAPPTLITLSDADVSFDRIDTFIVTTDSTVEALEGSPSANPIEPTIDFNNQLRVTIATIASGETSPQGVTEDVVYNENVESPNEWDIAISTTNVDTVIDTAYPTNPYNGSLSIRASSTIGTDSIRFTKTSAINLADVSSLSMALKLGSSAITVSLTLTFYLSNTPIGSLSISDGQYGFSSYTKNYQLLNIPTSSILLSGSTFDAVSFQLEESNSLDYKVYELDFIRFISGIENPIESGTFIGLSDTPDTYSGKEGYVPSVKEEEDGLVFTPINELIFDGVPNNPWAGDGDDISVLLSNLDDEINFVYDDIGVNEDSIADNASDIQTNQNDILELQNKFPLTKETEGIGTSIDLRYIGGHTTNVSSPSGATVYNTILGLVLNGNQTTFTNTPTEPVSSTSLLLTVTGTSGELKITVIDRLTAVSTDYLVTFNTSTTQTATDFVTTHAAAILANHGYTVTSLSDGIIFSGVWNGVVQVKTNSGDISATRTGALSRKVFGADFEADTEMKMCWEYNGEHIEYYFIKVLV